jgi:hypothetical protein
LKLRRRIERMDAIFGATWGLFQLLIYISLTLGLVMLVIGFGWAFIILCAGTGLRAGEKLFFSLINALKALLKKKAEEKEKIEDD